MDLVHQLTPMLKSLRLSGILETLELRNRGAIESKLSYVEFLAQLVEDEVERRAQHKLKMRLRRAAFDPQKTLETFDFTACPKLLQKEIADLATCRFVERHENVFFVGPAGVGKSHLAQALGHEACRRGYDVLFMPAARALAQLAAGRADGTYERRLAAFARPQLLILDDFGLKPLRPPAPEDLYEIVAERYEKASMIVTSNRAFAEWPSSASRSSPAPHSTASPTTPTRSSSPARASAPVPPAGGLPRRRDRTRREPTGERGRGGSACPPSRWISWGCH